MSRSTFLNGIRGVLVAALVLSLLLAAPAAFNWAGRDGRQAPTMSAADQMENMAVQTWYKKHPRPVAQPRPDGLAPFGRDFKADAPQDVRGHITTAVGFLDLKHPSRLTDRLPAEFKAQGPGFRSHGKGTLRDGVNIVQIDAASLQSMGHDKIADQVGKYGRIVGEVPDRGFLVRGAAADLAHLATESFVEATGEYLAAYKVDPMIGQTALIQASRARSTTLDLQVQLWQGEGPAAKGRLAKIFGESNVSDYSMDGQLLRVKAQRGDLAKLADDDGVRYFTEVPEFMLNNDEVAPQMMIGNTKDSFNLSKPFHEAGIDGGGSGALLCTQSPTRTCATNNDCTALSQCVAAGNPTACCTGAGTGTCTGPSPGGTCTLQKYNNGTAAVPPQIVAVTDNGITVDAVHFSQTLTQVSDLSHSFTSGSAHRKIQSIQNVEDNGSSCDGLLSGANTHGNVVAGAIAAAPGDFGIQYAKAIDPAEGAPIFNLSLDALARGSRILMQDAAAPSRCVYAELIEVGGNVNPGPIMDRLNYAICPKSGGTGACNGVVGGGDEVHLHVLPFGLPQFDTILFNQAAEGMYTLEAQQIDTFLVNNLDYMVFSPVGSQGTDPGDIATGKIWPDMFDGTKADDDPNFPRTMQIPPPATAKNSVTVGASFVDSWTVTPGQNDEESDYNITSHGPATEASGRTAPLIMTPGADGSSVFGTPLFEAIATTRSHDNDNAGTVENEIDDQNYGTSFSAALATAAGALIRDYFAQGFYPTGTRQSNDRMIKVSGSLVRAALVASANILDRNALDQSHGKQVNTNDKLVANTRGTDMGTINGVAVGVIGNNEQGYGRAIVDEVLPIPNYPPTRGVGAPETVEYPAAGLIVYDMIGTGEPVINNTNTLTEKTFVVDGVNPVILGGHRFIENGQLRIALSWPDPPSAATGTLANKGSGELVNDLDLEVESPGPDNNIATTADNIVYDGNVYTSGKTLQIGQWSRGRATTDPAVHDKRNTIEAVHLSTFVSKFLVNNGNQLATGTWKVRVKRGAGGLTPGQITQITGNPEDANGDGRLAVGACSNDNTKFCYNNGQCGAGNTCVGTLEDTNGNGLLDSGGQPFSLVIAGPVFGSSGQTQSWVSNSVLSAHALPASLMRLNKAQYSCSDFLVATVTDPNATAGTVGPNVVFQVRNAAGALLDEELGVTFTNSAKDPGGHTFVSPSLPTRLGNPAVKYNGVLEGDNGQVVIVHYTDSPRDSEVQAKFQCTPNIIQASLAVNGRTDVNSFIGGGCDGDQYLDANERVTYSVAIQNYELADDLNDVVATLTPTGPGAAAIRVLDSPKNVGRIPGGQRTGVTFSIFVDPTVVSGLSQANRKVSLVLSFDGSSRGVRLSRTTYTFDHVINADKESLHYSTDFPAGGREVRDFNRNLQIDAVDKIDPFKGVFFPDEDITFSSMFVVGTSTGKVSNTLGEDLDDNNILGPTEDVNGNGRLDRGILASATGPTLGADKVPWNFDRNDGGWFPLRSTFSRVNAAFNSNPVWEYQGGGLCTGGPTPGKQCFATADCGAGGTCNFHTGICGFQSAIADNPPNAVLWFQNGGAGIWHTGDGDPTTPAGNAQACDNYRMPHDGTTPDLTELFYDVLESPVISKVNQGVDSRGFPYTVEFQRLGVNINIQTQDYAGGGIDLDNDIDSDQQNCLICQYVYGIRFPDIYSIIVFNSYERGIDPISSVPQRTFGPLTDPDGSFAQNKTITGDETGFTGFTENTNVHSTSPIPVGDTNFTPFPRPGGAVIGAPGCTCNIDPNQACCEKNTPQGPERNLDVSLLDYEDGIITLNLGPGVNGPTGAFSPGPAKNRWQLGIGFMVVENASLLTDYGVGIDDVVLEWDESHPVDESAFIPAHTPACNRFGTAGNPAGQQCATLAVDRLNLYECNDTVEITVDDPRRSAQPTVTVFGVTDSDNIEVQTGVVAAKHPRKSFTIPAVAGSPGLFRGNVTLAALFDNPSLLFTGVNDSNMTFYYLDPECDGDGDGTAGENSFGNLDNDNIVSSSDNCPFDYNPTQTDTDGDGVGNICDNCPGVSNGPLTPGIAPDAIQKDSDADGVGDVCDFDDIDFDGVVNSIDNCPDVYNPNQVLAGGGSTRGAACNGTTDIDGDGIQDKVDKCVRTPKVGLSDSDLDNDGIGDACDGDCLNARPATLPIGSCNLINETFCTANSNPSCPVGQTCCPQVGHCSINTTLLCTASNQCPGNQTCVAFVNQTCQKAGLINDGSCGTVEDDADGDSVPDNVDDCPNTPNPPNIPGTLHQPDADQDGRGDACDPPETLDDDNDGIPDDAISFNTTMACKKLPLPQLVVLPGAPHDTNGDHDSFADAGEIVRMGVAVRNNSLVSVTGVNLLLGTADPNISCITKNTVLIPAIAAGATVNTSDQGAAGEFEFIVSPSVSTTSPTNPAKASFFITLSSNEAVGVGGKPNFSMLLDLDPPSGGLPAKVAGFDNLAGTLDDGIIKEEFGLDRDGDGLFTLDSRCHTLAGPDPAGPTGCVQDTPGVKNDTIGVTVGTAPGGIGVLAGVGCAGFNVPPADPECRIEPDNDMDWHIHCLPGGPGAVCPNSTPHQTPTDDGHAYSGDKSLHWGWHNDLTNRLFDTVKFRQLAAFMTNPINLTPAPGVGDLELSFYHIASMMDNNWYNLPPGQANDFGDVQIQTDRDNNPAVDDWSPWDKLIPSQNVYDHIAYIWSAFGTGTTYCLLTPTDTGTAPPAPRGVHETLCYPLGVWSSCGNARDETSPYQCSGETVGATAPPTGSLWVQSKFDLGSYLGQRVRIRWIAQAWEFDCCSSSYEEVGSWVGTMGDEGWYVDDIQITGALNAQAPPLADLKPVANGACPNKACDNTQGDSGFIVSMSVPQLTCVGGPTPGKACASDADCGAGGVCDQFVAGGESLLISATGTTNPGGCVGGGSQFRFFKNNVLVQDWSEIPTFTDNPSSDATYRVQVRCSIDTTCTSSATATASNTRNVQVFTGDGADIPLSVAFNRTAIPPLTTLSWPARLQPPALSGYDVYRGTQQDDGSGTTPKVPDTGLLTLGNLQCNVANTALGTTVSMTTTGEPSSGSAHYYLVGHNPVLGTAQVALGRRGDGTLRPLANNCP